MKIGCLLVPWRRTILFTVILCVRLIHCESVVSVFHDPSVIKLNHLTVDKESGNIYIGGVNRLYQLNENLETTTKVVTGPKEDSPDCSSRECPQNVEKRLTDNYNKVLVIDENENRLITCGSLFQGICSIRNLRNISEEYAEVREAVVANNSTASTVAFIAPGPSASNVLYVGVTYTGNSHYYRSEVPAVSSRSLNRNELFQIAKTEVTTGTRIFVNSLSREIYPINYIFGFSSGGFSYFLTTQKKSTHNNMWISKLVRICHEDREYYSYTEIPIECNENGQRFELIQAASIAKPSPDLAADLDVMLNEDILYAVFSESSGHDPSQPSENSALCVYSLKSIRKKYMENIQKCFSGHGLRGLEFISENRACTATKLNTITEDFCGLDVNTPLGGEEPVREKPLATFTNHLTAITATSTGEFTVAFLGTAEGHIKKVVIETNQGAIGGAPRLALEYGDLVIDEGKPVNPDLSFDPQKKHLYVMTEKKVSKLRVQECGVYRTCGECLGARDPYCGWCSLENKCSLRTDCQDAVRDPLYWVPYRSGRCTTITAVTPHQIQRTTARTLGLVIDNLPALSGQFLCAFTALGKTLVTNATRTTNGVSCTTPRTDLIPHNPPGQQHFTAKLSVRMSSGPDFVTTNFTFFDCTTYTSCTACVSSSFPCDWCVDGHRCTHDTAENCRNDILVTGINRIGPSIRSGPSFCPRINGTAGSTEILVSSGTKKKINVKVDNIAQFIVHTRFVCQFNIEGRVSTVPANVISDTIYCDDMEFSYASRQPNITATFAVIWGGSKPLDNPDNVHILIYRCREMADNCGMCLALPGKYGCGWCQASDRCEVREQCGGGAAGWLDPNQTCPNPQITHFEPRLGPWEGGTNITITGVNLGKVFKDIYGGVTVAGMQCSPYEHLYVRTRKIVCLVDSPGISEARRGPVIVRVADFRGESQAYYEFVDPVIYGIHPKKGPQSGGTLLAIHGKHMNAGSSIKAFIDDLPCEIIHANSSHAECRTSRAPTLQKGELKMKFDKGERLLQKELFEYVEDPTVEYAESGVINSLRIPKGIPSGGITISVTGNHFDYIQDPRMYVEYHHMKFSSSCTVISKIRMECRSPAVPIPYEIQKQLNADDPEKLDYGFLMDNVTAVQKLWKDKGYSPFLLYPDPIYEKFDEEIKYYKSDYLTINGQHLDRAGQESDVQVLIGVERCNVTSLSRNQLTCRPPPTQPKAFGFDPNDLPEVVVIVGGNRRYPIGRLNYAQPNGQEGPIPKIVIIAVAIGGGLLLLVVVGILIAYRRKSTESSRVLKSMQEHMDMLELQVAAECKEAFAELQTEMTDLTSDLTSGGIPFLDYRTYTMKILFPNIEDHGILQWERPELTRKEKGLKFFGQLLMNKTFLLLFIRTLESNRYFYMKDRVNVAALIMVTLQGKMEYCTDILKTLLADLIEKCMDGKSHPKLLLRRTESVAEKMLSAWFTFLLYKFLRECAGEPLYFLFRAIKHQVEKGPVDHVTSEARYSLSEEKLIRQSIDYRHMTVFVSISSQTIYVSGLEASTDNTDTPVKVLDCDTITQVKEKALDTIYRSTPFSQRPRKEDLDLEWRTGTSGRLILYDEDTTSKMEGEWKKLNTLVHYRVPDGAQLTLVPKQASMYNLSLISDRNEKSHHKYETLNLNFSKFSSSPPMSRATSPMNHHFYHPVNTHPNHGSLQYNDYRHNEKIDNHECGVKCWHLVRHHDNDNRKEGERGNKMVSEIYLTRLLSTKMTLQKYIDDLFETIFSIANRGSALPLAIKYMFDFLDDQALHHGITDCEVVHTWKSNSLPLRFWVNLIKNPNFVFDVNKSNIVDACLSVAAQTFMDSCSTSDHRLGKDSPSSKLLFAKDIPVYKEWVDRYYADIKAMPAISDQDMNAMLAEESRLHSLEFNTNCALFELYSYAHKYSEQLNTALEEDEFSQKQRLAYRLDQVHLLMQPDANSP
ncbi:plexin-A4-like isoform X2 [Artemia franciscana]